MRKSVFGRKLGRNQNSRKALRRSLVRAMVLKGTITTTKVKAKVVLPDIEKLMSLVRKDSVASRRKVKAMVGDKQIVEKLFSDYKSLTKKRKSGFVRMRKAASRRGDLAEMVRMEWVGDQDEENISTKT